MYGMNNSYNSLPQYQQLQLQQYQPQTFLQQPQMQMQQQNNENMKWVAVNGIEGAKSHIVQPNSTCWMLDNNESKFYVKSADAYGVTTLKAFEFTEITNKNDFKEVSKESNINLSEYIKKSEIDEIIANKIQQIMSNDNKEVIANE